MSDELAKPKVGVVIKNYGLRWQRQFVDFKRRPIKIFGYLEGSKVRTEVNFASQIGVYALYDGPELVYVGRAVKGKHPLGERLRAHHKHPTKADRWTTFSWFGFRIVNKTTQEPFQKETSSVRQVTTTQLAEVFEGLMIEFIRPRLNNRGGDLSNVDKYVQARPEEDRDDEG